MLKRSQMGSMGDRGGLCFNLVSQSYILYMKYKYKLPPQSIPFLAL